MHISSNLGIGIGVFRDIYFMQGGNIPFINIDFSKQDWSFYIVLTQGL